jgi:hypothetical protein
MDQVIEILKSGTFWTAVGSIAAVAGVLIAILPRGKRLSRQERVRTEAQAQEAAKKFDYWMKRYTHIGDKTDSERFIEWLYADKGYAKVAEQYAVFVKTAKNLKKYGYDISPPPTEAEFIVAVEQAKER